MTRLPALHDELVAAARRLDAAATPRRRRAPAARVLLVALLAALALAAIGAAATGLLGRGSDVPPRSGKAPTPKTGYGVPAGTVAPPIVVPDPEGDRLDWGLRAFTTTRGYACVQLGRVQDGTLGLVGRDGAFADDGLFHALGPQVLEAPNCVPLDARGHGFLALHDAERPASAVRTCLPPTMVHAFGGRVPKGATACATAGMRTVDFGLLGPRATSVTYSLPSGERRTAPVAAGTGAYLVVTPRQRLARTSRPGEIPPEAWTVNRTPTASTLVAVTYDDGTVCRVRRSGCPAKGYVAPQVRLPSRAAVATAVAARIARNDEGSFTLHVRFRARVAARQARAGYVVTIRPPRGPRCHQGVRSDSLARDVAAGQRVGAAIKLARTSCSGRYRIDLEYRVARDGPVLGDGLGYPGVRVGSARTELVK